MSVGPGSSDSRSPGAAPVPSDLQDSDLGAYLRSLEGQVQAMGLELHGLRQLLQEAGLISSASFSAWVRQIDGRDGAEAGRLQHRNDQSCRSCGRRLSWNARRCVYCGSSDLVGTIPSA